MLGARIDYVLVSSDLLDKLEGADISTNVIGSDHCPVWTTLSLPNEEQSISKRRNPPRLCAKYLDAVGPNQSIRTLFSNVPGHIVLKSSTKVSAPSLTEKAEQEKLMGTINGPPKKKLKTSTTKIIPKEKPTSKESPGQRSMNDFFQRKNTRQNKSQSDNPESQSSESSDFPPDVLDTSETIPESLYDYDIRESAKAATSEEWASIFKPKGAPSCDVHGLPCIELATKKPGPNLGRRFWICSKPVGPGYDNGKRQKREINPEFRCNYFKWANYLMKLI
jgi:AP endonuclease 2